MSREWRDRLSSLLSRLLSRALWILQAVVPLIPSTLDVLTHLESERQQSHYAAITSPQHVTQTYHSDPARRTSKEPALVVSVQLVWDMPTGTSIYDVVPNPPLSTRVRAQSGPPPHSPTGTGAREDSSS